MIKRLHLKGTGFDAQVPTYELPAKEGMPFFKKNPNGRR